MNKKSEGVIIIDVTPLPSENTIFLIKSFIWLFTIIFAIWFLF